MAPMLRQRSNSFRNESKKEFHKAREKHLTRFSTLARLARKN